MLSWVLVLGLLGAAPKPAVAPAPPKPAAPKSAPLPAAAPFAWRVPGLVGELDVPGEMNVGGMPIRLQVYTSRESISTLLQSFATAADEAGYYLQSRPPRLMGQPHLTALDTRTFTAYTVILEPAAGGQTTVILGEAKMGDSAPGPAQDSLVPLYPGASQVLRGDFEGAHTLAYHAPAGAPVVDTWYREQLARAGYTEEQPLVFRRKAQQVRVSTRAESEGSAVLLFIETAALSPDLNP
jgi:hypothetical protein